jgi:uncharacterized protein
MIIDMIERGQPCQQIAQRLQVVEGAIGKVKKALMNAHISERLEKLVKTALASGLAPGLPS